MISPELKSVDRRIRMVMISVMAILMISFASAAQDQEKADSLKTLLFEGNKLTLREHVVVLSNLSQLSSSPDEVLTYSTQLLKSAVDANLIEYRIKAHQYQGVAYRMKGDLKRSLTSLFESAELAYEHAHFNLQAEAYLEIANTYTVENNLKNALNYEAKAIAILRVYGDKRSLAINLLNVGYSYYTLNELDSALALYNEAEPIFDSIGLAIGKAYSIGNRALIYLKKHDYSLAEADLLKAIDMLLPLGDEFGMADYHNQLGRLYFETGKFEKAIMHAHKTLQMAEANDLKEQIRDASLLLSELYEAKRDFQKALKYQAQFIAFKDSIESAEKTREMADLRTEFEVSLREKEIDLLQNERKLNRGYIAIAVILLIFSIVVLLYFRQRFRNTKLMADRQRKLNDERIENLLREQETRAIQSLFVGREEERKRIAHDLHNHLGSLLATIKVNLNAVGEEDIPNFKTLSSLVDQACSDVRGMSHSLNMGISKDFGLIPALRDLVKHLQQSGSIEVEFNASMLECRLDSASEILIYRIVQELVSNVLKHAQASRLSILLTCFEEDNLMNIMVQDNGKGFETGEPDDLRFKGMGIASIREMVSYRHGDITIDSNPASGTTVNIDLPINDTSFE